MTLPANQQALVETLFGSYPTDGSVASGATVAVVNHLRAVTPGLRDQAWPTSDGPAYKQIFFPNYQPVAFEGDVAAVTGIGDATWSDFVVALIVQADYYQGPNVSDIISLDKVTSELAGCNATMRGQATPWYTHVLANTYPPFTAVASACAGDLPDAVAYYLARLGGSDYANEALARFQAGQAGDFASEVFHHGVKLQGLGASADQINTAIGQLAANFASAGQEALFPAGLTGGQWVNHTTWYVDLDYHAIYDGSLQSGLNNSTGEPIPAGDGPPADPAADGVEFLMDGEPASSYWHSPPSGSCVSEDAFVVMADGSLRPVTAVEPGEKVATPDGPREVLTVTDPPLGDRTLYTVNGAGFGVTGSHPFLSPGDTGQPETVAIDPHLTAYWLPTFSHGGIGPLTVGTPLLRWSSAQTEIVSVESIEPRRQPHGPRVCGIVMVPDGNAPAGYFAGDRTQQFLVASEVPVPARAPWATFAVLAAVQAAVTGSPWVAGHREWLERVAGWAVSQVPRSLAVVSGLGPTGTGDAGGDPARMVAESLPLFADPERGFVATTLFEHIVARFAEPVEDMVALAGQPRPEGGPPWRVLHEVRAHRSTGLREEPGRLELDGTTAPADASRSASAFAHVLDAPLVATGGVLRYSTDGADGRPLVFEGRLEPGASSLVLTAGDGSTATARCATYDAWPGPLSADPSATLTALGQRIGEAISRELLRMGHRRAQAGGEAHQGS